MKIEKINNNQIKCILNKSDLVDREIKVNELAYGTKKAQQLFKDMMTKADTEFGFKANNVPLMIEAVPLSSDSIMLIITKVEDPEELENKLSRISKPRARTIKKEKTGSSDSGLSSNNLTKLEKNDSKPISIHYVFDDLNLISKAANRLSDYNVAASSIYKDSANGKYYLELELPGSEKNTVFSITGTLSEYGTYVAKNTITGNYYREHYDLIVKDNALSIMA